MCTSKAAGSKRENKQKSKALTSGLLIFYRQPCPRPLFGICLYSAMAVRTPPAKEATSCALLLYLSLSRTSAQALAKSLVWGSFPLSLLLLLLLSRFSCVRLCATLWTAAHQAPPSLGFSRQEYWSGVPLPSPPISFSTHLFPTQWLSFPVFQLRESAPCGKLCPANIAVQPDGGNCQKHGMWRQWWVLQWPLAKELPVYHPAAFSSLPLLFLLGNCLTLLSAWTVSKGKMAPGISGPSPSSCPVFLALFPVITRPMSHLSVQLFLLECKGFSGYKLYLAKVKVCITQSVGHRIQSLNILVLVFLLHSSTNGFFQT